MSALIKEQLRAAAQELGFDAFGVAALPEELRSDYYRDWIARGGHAEMSRLEEDNERRLHPRKVMPHARSILCLGINYYQEVEQPRGAIARYALGRDYDEWIEERLEQLNKLIRRQGGHSRAYVDAGPILEKPLAAMAGLGWQGKNTLLISPEYGNWLFLGVIVTTLELPADAPYPDRCGSCSLCLDACPTQALVAPYQLDARRCVAYLTIEHQGAIPTEMREHIGDRLFGCDDCLAACPWNRWARQTRELRFVARETPDPVEILQWTEAEFYQRFTATPIARLGLERLQRNACIVLGNIGGQEDLQILQRLEQSLTLLVQEHARWACERIRDRLSR